jgi:hypothetical protein
MNWLGLIAAATAFLSIWVGHVAVRKIEASSRTIWVPMVAAIVLGVSLEYLSLIVDNLLLKTAFGITGITFLWDALEFTRQQNRVKHGHAPANPNNPRHTRILKEHLSATTIDLLNREPTGSQITGQRTP